MPTETTNKRLKSAFVVLSAIDEFRHRALPGLAAQPTAAEAPQIDYGEWLDALHAQLSWSYNDLFRKDVTYIHELADDTKYFRQRDEIGGNLSEVILRCRGIFDNGYKPANIEEFGFPRNISQDPEQLFQQGQHLDERLREPGLPLPKPLSEKLAIDPTALADVVKSWLTQFDEALAHVRRERREATLARLARQEAVASFDDKFLWVSRTTESLFSLAGEKELAKRVRPSVTRPGRTETDPDEILSETGQAAPDFDQADPTEPLPGSGPDFDPDNPPPDGGPQEG